MLTKIKQFVGVFTFLKTMGFVLMVKAAEIPYSYHGDLPGSDPISTEDGYKMEYFLTQILPNFIQWFLGFLASASILVIMIGGYMYLTAFGGEQTDKAKKTIMYAVIGLLVTILSYAIVSIVQNIDFFNT